MIDTKNYVPQSKTTSFDAFPADKQERMAQIQADKLKSVAHLPHPVDIPGITSARPPMQQAPALQAVDPRVQDAMVRPQHAQRPGVAYVPQPQNPEAQADAMFRDAMAQPMHPAVAASMQQQQPDPRWVPQSAPSIPQPVAHAPVPQQKVAPNLVQSYVNQVASQHPGVITPVADGEYSSVELPSRFAFYGFTDLYVCPFRAKHLGKLQKANREQSLLAMVEAVSAVCYTTAPAFAGRPMAFELTLPDFFFVLYWLRLNSFTKSNYVHHAECKDKNHKKRVSYTINAAEFDRQLAAGEITQEQRDEID